MSFSKLSVLSTVEPVLIFVDAVIFLTSLSFLN
jgi:hypothetical protein